MKILLLLHDYYELNSEYEIPLNVTQKGIGDELSLHQSHVSRSLTHLLNENYIISKSTHIKGIHRRKKAYFLTEKGLKYTNYLINIINKHQYLIQINNNQIIQGTISEAQSIIYNTFGIKPTTFHMVSSYIKGNCIFISNNNELNSNNNIPIMKIFIDRERELNQILEYYNNIKCPYIFITGLAGIGKTSLITKFIEDKNDISKCWLTLNEWTSTDYIINKWKQFAYNKGVNLKQSQNINLPPYKHDIAEIVKLIINNKFLFIIDDFHKSEKDVHDFFKYIITNISECKSTFIFSTRIRPEFLSIKELLYGKISEIKLTELDEKSSYKILEEKGIQIQDYKIIYQLTKGHPLALEIITGDLKNIKEKNSLHLAKYIDEEILTNLSNDEIEVLYLASIYEKPVDIEGLIQQKNVPISIIDKLEKMMLLQPFHNGCFGIHSLLKRIIENRMTYFEKQKHFNLAIEYLSLNDSYENLTHKYLIYNKYEKKEELEEFILDYGEVLIPYNAEKVSEIYSSINKTNLSKFQYIKYLLISADLDILEDHLTSADSKLDIGLIETDNILNSNYPVHIKDECIEYISKIYNRKAKISSFLKKDDAIVLLQKNIEHNKKYGDITGWGKALNNLGVAYTKKGDFENSIKTLKKAKKLFKDIHDYTSIAFIELNIADVYLLLRNNEEVINHIQRASHITIRQPYLCGLIHRKIGITYSKMKDYNKSIQYLSFAYGKFKQYNDEIQSLLTLCFLFHSTLLNNNIIPAKDYIKSIDKEIQKISDININIKEISILHLRNIAMISTSLKKENYYLYITNILKKLHEISNDKEMIIIIREILPFFNSNECKIIFLKICLKIYEKYNTIKGLVILYLWLGNIYSVDGKNNHAIDIYRKSLKYAKITGYFSAEKELNKKIDIIQSKI